LLIEFSTFWLTSLEGLNSSVLFYVSFQTDIGIEIHVSAADLVTLEVEIDIVQDNKPLKDKIDSVHADMPIVVGPTNDVRIVECNNNEVTNQPSLADKPAQTKGNMKKKRRGQFVKFAIILQTICVPMC
jgi:hypothetical protein